MTSFSQNILTCSRISVNKIVQSDAFLSERNLFPCARCTNPGLFYLTLTFLTSLQDEQYLFPLTVLYVRILT